MEEAIESYVNTKPMNSYANVTKNGEFTTVSTTGSITANTGFTGNLTGDVTGNTTFLRHNAVYYEMFQLKRFLSYEYAKRGNHLALCARRKEKQIHPRPLVSSSSTKEKTSHFAKLDKI